MNIAEYDKTMQRVRVQGVALIASTAGKLFYSDRDNRMTMVELFDYGTDSKLKTYLIQANGYVMVNNTVGTLRVLHLEHKFDKYKFERLS